MGLGSLAFANTACISRDLIVRAGLALAITIGCDCTKTIYET